MVDDYMLRGYSVKDLAEKYHRSRHQISNWLKSLGLAVPNRAAQKCSSQGRKVRSRSPLVRELCELLVLAEYFYGPLSRDDIDTVMRYLFEARNAQRRREAAQNGREIA